MRRPLGSRLLTLCYPCVLGVSACTFEARFSDSAAGSEAFGVGVESTTGAESRNPEDLARSTVDSFREAVAGGDLSFALSQLDPAATVVDPLVRGDAEGISLGELLLELRTRHGEGITYDAEPERVEILVTGETVALVVSHLSLLREMDGGGQDRMGSVVETVYLVRSEDGWRIRHLHRSFLTDP